jgi:hypothetical protein
MRDAAAIDAAKQVLVQAIDPALPRVSLEAWLRAIVGTEAATKWEVNDCGEQTGDPKQDEDRDFPMCAEAAVSLGSQRELHVSLAVGSFKKGVGGVPSLWAAYIRRASGSPEWLRGLAAIPSAIRLGDAAVTALTIGQTPAARVAQFSSYIRGERWDFDVTRADIEGAPAWKDADSAPPLSPRNAIAGATKRLSGLVPDWTQWTLNRVALQTLGAGRWLYLVEYQPPPPTPMGGITASVSFVVLLDGRAIIPTRTPWPREPLK